MRDIIIYFTHKYFGDWERIYDAIEKQEEVDFDVVEDIKEEYEGRYVTVLDEDYPKELKLTKRPPFMLFFKGNKELFYKKRKFWLFGNYYTEEFDDVTNKMYDQIDKADYNVVSGYTNDFERKFINSTKPKGMIIIKDSGIDSYINMTRIEERYLMKDNLIVSEYPGKVIPSLHTWEMAGRIKSGLSESMIVINSLKDKITFKLIFDAIEERRRIYCYNGVIDKKSHNSILISKGAYAINSMYDIKEKN